MSQGKTQEWIDADQHVEAYHDRQAEIINGYANAMIRRDQLAGPQMAWADEKAPDGRSIKQDYAGHYRATQSELGLDK